MLVGHIRVVEVLGEGVPLEKMSCLDANSTIKEQELKTEKCDTSRSTEKHM